jgi:nitrate reductase gamma subunit
MTWIKKHLWAVLGCLCSVLSFLTWHSYMAIHVKANHNATVLGRIGFNMDEIHMMAGVVAGVAVILSGIGLYQNRQKQKASIEDIALILSISAILLSGTYI